MGKAEVRRAAIVAAQAAREAAELEARRQAGVDGPRKRRTSGSSQPMRRPFKLP
jgi:hypothetical protein